MLDDMDVLALKTEHHHYLGPPRRRVDHLSQYPARGSSAFTAKVNPAWINTSRAPGPRCIG